MRWKDIKLGSKIMIGIGSALLMLILVGVWSFYGIDNIVRNGKEVAGGNRLKGVLLQREIDHLNWASKVSSFLNDDQIMELTVQTDHRLCGFGKWYYGEGRKQAESLVPDLKETLKAIEEPHKELHQSAIKIKKVFRQSDPEPPAFLANKISDHLVWIEKIQRAILMKKKSVDVILDHKNCSLGQFIHGHEGMILSWAAPTMGNDIEKIKKPHEKLHNLGKKVQKALSRGEVKLATQIYQKEMLPVLQSVKKILIAMRDRSQENIESRNEAQVIFSAQSQPNLRKIQQFLRELIDLADKNILSEEQMVQQAIHTRRVIVIISLIAVLIGLMLAILITKSITGPIQKGVAFAHTVANGDLRHDLDVRQKDEVGALADALREMMSKLRTIINDVKTAADSVNTSSRDLASSSTQMASSAEDLKKRSSKAADSSTQITANVNTMAAANEEASTNVSTVASSIEELSANVNTVAAAAEQASVNMAGISENFGQMTGDITNVADSIEQMSISLSDVNQKSHKAVEITLEANDSAKQTLEAMNQLSENAGKVGQIVKLIDNIASQTNMLALNATIEAASAGESGKGFAVVATEVKELALQTAGANREIAEQIKEIQDYVTDSLYYTESVNKVINQVSQINHNIASLIKEQSTVAFGISQSVESISQSGNDSANNLREASEGLKEITRSVAEASDVSKSSTRNLAEVAYGVQEIASSSSNVSQEVQSVNDHVRGVSSSINEMMEVVSQTNSNAENMSKTAAQLEKSIAWFQVNQTTL